jgi:hypothetical protein
MSLWGNLDQANNAPKNPVASGLGVSSNGEVLFANSQQGGIVSGIGLGVFGANTTEVGSAAVGENLTRAAHAGWNIVKTGTGPVATISVANTGSGFNASQNGFVTFTGYGSGANAQWFANATGHINVVNLLVPGQNYNVAPTGIAVNANANGTNATFTTTVGGRAGRVQVETIVAMGSMN